jgi:hypothetical protein
VPESALISTKETVLDFTITAEGHFDRELLSAFLSKMVTNGTIH